MPTTLSLRKYLDGWYNKTMARKVKDNLIILGAALLLFATAMLHCLAFHTHPIILLISSLITFLLVLRTIKVITKKVLEYLNGPRKFCKGNGIEIGSGSRPIIKGSLSVDVVTSYSNDIGYKVDYVADAHSLPEIGTGSLDYVCASHVLEHLADPIKALIEWMRVLKPGGILWLKVPDKRKTFDRRRQRTPIAHLVEDFKKDVPVDDTTHIEDNNINSDPPRDVAYPYVHNHVWIPEDIAELFTYIKDNHVPLKVVRLSENSCKNAQDFWVLVEKG